MYRIDKNVPIPPNVGRACRPSKYPFSRMEIGHSFPVDEAEHERVKNASKQYERKHSQKFAMGWDDDGQLRCWRVE